MSSSLNKVQLIGRIGKLSELRAMANGTSVVKLSLATSDKWKDKTSGELKETTEWHNVIFFSKLAEIAASYLVKGAKIYVSGKLKTRKWQDQSGVDRIITEVYGDELIMLDSRTDSAKVSADTIKTSASEIAAPSFDDDIPF